MKLPAKVHRKGPSLYYVHQNKWIRLCPADAPEYVIHNEIAKLLQKDRYTVGDVMNDYMTTRMTKLALSTQKEYESVINKRLRPWCGHMVPDDLTSQDVAVYLESRDRANHGASGNREVAVLSSIYSHGMRIRACTFNPCYGVRRNKEAPRTYYVTDVSLRLALKRANPGLRYLIWAAYLTGFRQSDLRGLTEANLTEEGIQVIQSKDGKNELRLWSDSLRKLVKRARSRSRCEYVLTNERGQHWTKEAVTSAMGRLKRDTGIEWRFHDLRAKAESDHQTGLGLMRRYARARRIKAVR